MGIKRLKEDKELNLTPAELKSVEHLRDSGNTWLDWEDVIKRIVNYEIR